MPTMTLMKMVVCVFRSVFLRLSDNRTVLHGVLLHLQVDPGGRHNLGRSRISARWRFRDGLLRAVLQFGGAQRKTRFIHSI